MGSSPTVSVMIDKQLQQLIEEAKSVQKKYPYFDALAAAQSGELWRYLSDKQRKLVKRALMPCSEIGITSDK